MNSIKYKTRACFQTLSKCLGAETKREAEVRKVRHMMLHSLIIIIMTALAMGCDDGGGGTSSTTTNPPPVATVLEGQFYDDLVVGLSYSSDSQSGQTDSAGYFKYQQGEVVTFNVGGVILGSAPGKLRITPLDLTPNEKVVAAIASLLQSLDADNTDNVITLTSAKIALLDAQLGGGLDLASLTDEQVDGGALDPLHDAVLAVADTYVPPGEALVALLSNLAQEGYMTRNISKTPDVVSDKAGVEIMGASLPARTASGDLLTDYGDVHPILTSYYDGGDAWVAASYDNGASWKRTNLSRHAGKTINISNMTFTAAAKGPSMHVEGNYVLVSWISTYCQGAPDFMKAAEGLDLPEGMIPASVENPAKAILAAEDPSHDWYYDAAVDDGVEDLFKVLGSQGTVDYSAIYPNVGVVPYHCVWTARGVLDDETGSFGSSLGLEDTEGRFVWFKGQQLTSGVRDAKLNWPAGLEGHGFAVVWQGDPEGLMPGEGEGPGVGWSGAKTHHKTNIWYSYLKWADFALADTELDSETNRPQSLVALSVPIPVSDNDSCNVDANNPKVMCQTDAFCATTATVTTSGGDGSGTFCVVDYDNDPATYVEDIDAVLDGDTAASRPNLHFAAVLDGAGEIVGARALLMYEESKGLCELGQGCEESELYPYDIGKFVMYHHMEDFANPEVIHKGDILSAPVETATRDPFDDTASFVPEDNVDTPNFDESALYENARRERFVVNADPAHPTKLVVIYKQGWYNQGERADIFMRRAVGGYDVEYFEDDMCISCVTPESIGISDDDGTLTAKVESWSWSPLDLYNESWTNPYDDARSLRALLEGDRVLVGFAWTPNWALATNADANGNFKDHYDFFVRRSFDGGKSFTDINGLDEGPRNTSYLSNNKENVVEPRLATLGGTNISCEKDVDGYFKGGICSQVGDELTDPNLAQAFVVTYCTAANVEREPIGGIPVHAPGLDCYYSWTVDNGETYIAPLKEVQVVDESGTEVTIEVPDFQCLACTAQEEVEPEVKLTEGSSFADTVHAADHEGVMAEMHGAWVVNGVDDPNSGSDMHTGSDAWYGLFELKPELDTTEE